jgi:hypothetical protein
VVLRDTLTKGERSFLLRATQHSDADPEEASAQRGEDPSPKASDNQSFDTAERTKIGDDMLTGSEGHLNNRPGNEPISRQQTLADRGQQLRDLSHDLRILALKHRPIANTIVYKQPPLPSRECRSHRTKDHGTVKNIRSDDRIRIIWTAQINKLKRRSITHDLPLRTKLERHLGIGMKRPISRASIPAPRLQTRSRSEVANHRPAAEPLTLADAQLPPHTLSAPGQGRVPRLQLHLQSRDQSRLNIYDLPSVNPDPCSVELTPHRLGASEAHRTAESRARAGVHSWRDA